MCPKYTIKGLIYHTAKNILVCRCHYTNLSCLRVNRENKIKVIRHACQVRGNAERDVDRVRTAALPRVCDVYEVGARWASPVRCGNDNGS